MNKDITQRTLAIIGTGRVGGCFLFHAIQKNVAEKFIVIDVNEALAKSQIQDSEDTLNLNFVYPHIQLGSYQDLNNVDIIVITAGRTMKNNESRSDLIQTNGVIMNKIAVEIKKSGFNGIVIIASNPCDALAAIFQQASGLPSSRVISSGTVLDSARLRFLLSQHFKINTAQIEANFIGEHGETGFIPWSLVQVANKPLKETANFRAKSLTEDDLKKIEKKVIQRGPEINKIKGATEFGIAASLVTICEAIFKNTHTLLPVGVYHKNKNSKFGVYFSESAVITAQGVARVIKYDFTPEEQAKYDHTYKAVAALISHYDAQ